MEWAMVSTPQEIDDGASCWRCGEGHSGSQPLTDIVAPVDGHGQAVGYALVTQVSYAQRDSRPGIRSRWGAVTSMWVSIASLFRPRHP